MTRDLCVHGFSINCMHIIISLRNIVHLGTKFYEIPKIKFITV